MKYLFEVHLTNDILFISGISDKCWFHDDDFCISDLQNFSLFTILVKDIEVGILIKL